MAETPKLSVEKALEKLRSADAPKSKDARRTEEMDALDDEIKRMRAQRLRLDRHQRRPTKSDCIHHRFGSALNGRAESEGIVGRLGSNASSLSDD